jgi:MFS family permease
MSDSTRSRRPSVPGAAVGLGVTSGSAAAGAAPSADAELALRVRRRTTRRLIPFLGLLFAVAYLDRVNVSYAALEMTRELGFAPDVYGLGAGLFFIGYVLLEIPGALIVERWSARLWISRIMISWGVLAALTGFVETATQFYWARFLLGVGEAGFFPGIIVYLSHWFRERDRAKAVAMFMAAIPVASVLGAPVSGLLLGVHWMGLSGWRWVFILEGIPSVLLGVVVPFYLTDRPEQARWLAPDERAWLAAELARERAAKGAEPGHHFVRALAQLRQPRVLVLAGAYFAAVTAAYGFGLWLPTSVKSLSGLPNLAVTGIAALPYLAGFVAILVAGWSSDRTGERRWHAALPLGAVSLGLLLTALLRGNVPLAVASLCLTGAGLYGYLPGLWALPTTLLTGSAAAAAVGMINAVGNVGGFVGPYVVGRLNAATGSFVGGMLYLSASALVAAALVLSLRPTTTTARRERDPGERA